MYYKSPEDDNMKLSMEESGFLDAFDHLDTKFLDKHQKTKLDLFVLKINSNEFDYSSLKDILLEPVIDFALSRVVKEKYAGKPAHLSKKAREKFIDYIRNKGELGELLLYCFLETHLKAPKILTKLELKTSTSHYVNGSDGVHFLKLPNGNYQLIFGESKTKQGLNAALGDALKSIYEFKNEINTKGKTKSGLPYEKGLISDHLLKETFTKEEGEFLENILYPKKDSNFEVDDAFGIFIGYEIEITQEDKKLGNTEFREKIKTNIKKEISSQLKHIQDKILEHDLCGHHFYFYILPFTELDENRRSIQKDITQ